MTPAPGPPAPPIPPDPRDEAMELAIGRLLQAGVTLAAAVVFSGGVLYLRAHHAESVSYRVFHAEAPTLRNPITTLQAVSHGDPAAIIQLGVLLLIATPVARVVFAGVAFARERDRLYTAIAVVVLAVLLLGLSGVV